MIDTPANYSQALFATTGRFMSGENPDSAVVFALRFPLARQKGRFQLAALIGCGSGQVIGLTGIPDKVLEGRVIVLKRMHAFSRHHGLLPTFHSIE